MIISEEQARCAARYIRETPCEPASSESTACNPLHHDIPAEFLGRVREAVAETPEVRDDRLAEAFDMLDAPPSASAVASKMLSRIISDSVR